VIAWALERDPVHRADPDDPTFPAVLDRYFAGQPDERTEDLLGH
jgi:uncharacterized protein (DUF1810 family)